MGDSASVMHAFSYASGIPKEPIQGNPMHGLGESVSFGRFVSESLAWEKWSTFSHNRYVEEAERYAQPGSVAQKKAFFEAHYKRIAAKKAAALLQQANANALANITTAEPEAAESVVTITTTDNSIADSSHAVAVNQQSPEPEVKTEDLKPEPMIVLAENHQNSNVKPIEPATEEFMEPETPLETSIKKDSPDNLENQEMFSGSELSRTPQMEKPPLKSFISDQDVSSVKSKKMSAFSSLKSSVSRKTSKVPNTPAKPITPRIKKESNASSTITPITKKSTLDFMEKKTRSTPKSLHSFINSTPAKAVLYLAANRKTQNSRIAPDSYKASQDCMATPAKLITPRIKKERNASWTTTPIANKSTLDYIEKKRRSTPKSLRTFINSTPAKVVLTPAVNRKTQNSRIAPDSSKASQDCTTTSLRTQDTKATAKMSKHPSATTPANTRNNTPVDGNKTTGPRRNILSAASSNSLTAFRNKLQSPTLSTTPFILRTEERAARRKQKLEEKFNSKEVQKVQLQTKLKEKAELDLRKLRQSFCFKARSLPDFYKERLVQNNQMKKNPVTQPQPPELGRKPSSRTMQGKVSVSLPSATSLNKNSISNHVLGKNGRTAYFPASQPERISH